MGDPQGHRPGAQGPPSGCKGPVARMRQVTPSPHCGVGSPSFVRSFHSPLESIFAFLSEVCSGISLAVTQILRYKYEHPFHHTHMGPSLPSEPYLRPPCVDGLRWPHRICLIWRWSPGSVWRNLGQTNNTGGGGVARSTTKVQPRVSLSRIHAA